MKLTLTLQTFMEWKNENLRNKKIFLLRFDGNIDGIYSHAYPMQHYPTTCNRLELRKLIKTTFFFEGRGLLLCKHKFFIIKLTCLFFILKYVFLMSTSSVKHINIRTQ